MSDLAILNGLLDALQAKLPQLVADHPADSDFWMVFAAEAEAIEDKANGETYAHVMHRINDMLAEHGRYIVMGELEDA